MMDAPLPTPEAIPPRVPKGLEAVRPEEIQSHLDLGKQTAKENSLILRVKRKLDDQLEQLQAEAIARSEQTDPNYSGRINEIKTQKAAATARENEALQKEADINLHQARLKALDDSVKEVRAHGVDIVLEHVQKFDGGAHDIQGAIQSSTADLESLANDARAARALAMGEKRQLSYRKALREEWEKAKKHPDAVKQVAALEKALDAVEQSSEIDQYYAAQAVVVERVKQQAQTDQPLEAGVYKEADTLAKIVEATDKTELGHASRIDKALQTKKRGKKEYTSRVRGFQDRREIRIAQDADELFQSLSSEASSPNEAAVRRASERIVQMIESPGLGKKPIGTEYLTADALEKMIDEQDLVDPIRAFVQKKLIHRRSVEEVLGCKVEVTANAVDEKNPRKIEIKTAQQEGQGEAPTPLFASLAACESREIQLRENLSTIDATDVKKARVVVEALRQNDTQRQALLKLANARLNGFTTADGVRSGALKSIWADRTVRAVETVAVAYIFKSATQLAVDQAIAHGESIVRVANANMKPFIDLIGQPGQDQLANLYAQLSGATLDGAKQALGNLQGSADMLKGLNFDAIVNNLVGQHNVDAAKTGAEAMNGPLGDMGTKLGGYSEALKKLLGGIEQYKQLQQVIADAPSKIAALRGGALSGVGQAESSAQTSLTIGTSLGTLATATTLFDAYRRQASRPAKWIKHKVLPRITNFNPSNE